MAGRGENPRHLGWHDLGEQRAEAADGMDVTISGFPSAPLPAGGARHVVLLPEAACCAGCVPRDPLAAIEIFAAVPLAASRGALRLRGVWRRSDQAVWRYQLHDARPLDPPGWDGLTRRTMLSLGPLICLAACAADAPPPVTTPNLIDAKSVIASGPAIDLHSHAGGIANVARMRTGGAFGLVADPMRRGGMAATCLAVVSDGPIHRVMADGHIHPFREPLPGELYEYGTLAFGRVHELARDQSLPIIATKADLGAAKAGTPGVIIAAEGADFLEGQVERVDEAYTRWSLRHLQLTHYRVNELGDIQTETPVHGGLTDFGVEVIRRCNRLGIVVDIAHGTFDLVRRAASVTSRPLVLSHTSLSSRPGRFSRQITAEHAKLVADTGGVIGVWPPATIFPSLDAMAAGMARLVDIVGVDHVGLGSDMRGLVGSSVFADYDRLPDLAMALLGAGFNATDTAKLLGGNYARVFEANMAR